MTISATTVKELREKTNAGMMECKKALEEAKGNMEQAIEILRKKGMALAKKKESREAKEGVLGNFCDEAGTLAGLVEVNCETDFVAKNEDFCKFTKDVAMHIAASSPKYLSREDVPAEILSKEADQALFVKTHCLFEQPFVRDPQISIRDYLNSLISKTGENIMISRFIRYKVGEGE